MEFKEKVNREKLQEIFLNKDESEEAKQFIAEEYERCKDSYYFYMNYWYVEDANGNITPPQLLTKEQWDERTKYYEEQRYRLKPRYPACDYKKLFPET